MNRPPINDYSKLQGNRGIETTKGPIIPKPEWTLGEDGFPVDSNTPAYYMALAQREK